MVEIDIPHVFLDVEELAKRWHCGIGVIEMLAETGQIECCVRPVALEVALDKVWPKQERPDIQIPFPHRLDRTEIYRLFRHPTIPQIITSHKDKIPNAPDVRIAFADIVFFMDCIKDFEAKHKMYQESDFQIAASDFTCIIWQGKELKFGETQGKVIRMLWQAREKGELWVYGKRILSGIGSGSARIQSIFRNHKTWREIIATDSKGRYRLKLPPKPGLCDGIELGQQAKTIPHVFI